MLRGRHGGTIALLAIVTIALIAIIGLADDGEASWSGEPLPPWGSNWNINQDTVYRDEVIRLAGDIHLNSGYTLSLDGCTLLFNGTYDGDADFYVWFGSILYVNSTMSNTGTMKANASNPNWELWIYGEAYLDGVVMEDLWSGVWLSNSATFLWIEGCSIDSYHYGIDASSDLHVGNTTIVARSPSNLGYIYARGVRIRDAKASLHNLDITVVVRQDEYWNTSSYWFDVEAIGLLLESADVGKLHGGSDFKITMDIDITVRNHLDTSYVYMRNYYWTKALAMTGDTVLRELKDITIVTRERFHGVVNNATATGYVYVYNRQQYIYSSIGSSGEAPLDISSITLHNLSIDASVSGIENIVLNEYWDNYGMYFSDSADSRPGDVSTWFHDLTFRDSPLGYAIRMPQYGEWRMTDCLFEDLGIWNYLMYYYNGDSNYVIGWNTFRDITALRDYNPMFYISSADREGTITNNTFDVIEGWMLFYFDNPEDRVYFLYNTMTNMVQWDYVYDPWIYIWYNDDKITFLGNTITESTFGEGLMMVDNNQDRYLIEMNDVTDCVFGNYMIRTYYNRADIDVVNNDFLRNEGRLFWFEQIRGRLTVEENEIADNHAGADYLVYTYYTYEAMRFQDNEFLRNTADGSMIFFRGASYWGNYDFIFTRNLLKDNVASNALNGGLVVVRGAKNNLELRRNDFEGNTGNCINFYRPYTSNSWYYNTFTVDGNDFTGNDGVCTLWVDFRTYIIEVKRNTGSNNTGPLVKTVLTEWYVNDGFYPNCRGNMIGALEYRIENNHFTNNTGGGVHIHAQWVDANVAYSLYDQVVWITGNDLTHTSGDWAISVVDFGQFPFLLNNDFHGSQYGVFLQAIDYPGVFDRVLMEFVEERYDGGGPGGMTAWALVNIDADFYNCSFTNFMEALYVRDGTINVYWSAIPEASGRTEGRGYIYVWNHLEVHVTWADAQGVDSGEPAAGATLAMRGTNGRYYGALVTDEEGSIGPMLITPWTSSEGKMDAWSPFTGTVLAGGLTAVYTINVVGEMVGDDAVHLVIQDTVVPEIVINTPTEGSVSNMIDLPVEGFMFEAGSGIGSFMGYMDGGEGIEVDPMLQWSAVFEDVAQGEHTILFEVEDVAHNKANATVTFFIDGEVPLLDITKPSEGFRTRDAVLLVQGAVSDLVSDISDIVVRINAEPIDASAGVINEHVDLTEGVNTIVIDAKDKAGNVATVVRRVTLDTYPPTLYVYTPLDMLVTADRMLVVDGLSEAGTPIKVEQVRESDGEELDNVTVTADADGLFLTELLLQEGSQFVIVTAQDEAGNVRTITRTIILDTTPPDLFIDSPDQNADVNTPSVEVKGHIEDPDPELVVVRINGLLVEHIGVFSRVMPLLEGLNTIVVTATDTVDNTAVRRINVTRDTIPPVLAVDTPEFVLTNEGILEVTGVVNADADTVRVAGETVNVNEEGRFTHEVDLSQATRPIVVEAIDSAENRALFLIDFVYDPEDPVITFTPPPLAKTSRLVMYINGTVSDNEATIVTITVRGKVYPVVDGKFNVLLDVDTTGDGYNNFTVEATDGAGNTAVMKVSTQYVTPEDVDESEEIEEEGTDWLTYVGILLLIAAVVLIATVYVFASRGERQ